jgi:hypothetical protein
MNFNKGGGFYSAAITPFLVPPSGDLKKPTAYLAPKL